ncbi:MAG: hypothetical protein AMXMBFR7_03580 [Planctomycetota bacterium]
MLLRRWAVVWVLCLTPLARGGEAPSGNAPPGRWLPLGVYDFLNASEGLVLRAHEDLDDEYGTGAWKLYLIDLHKKTVRTIGPLAKPFVEVADPALGRVNLRLLGASMNADGSKVYLESRQRLPKGKSPAQVLQMREIYERDLKSGAERLVGQLPGWHQYANWGWGGWGHMAWGHDAVNERWWSIQQLAGQRTATELQVLDLKTGRMGRIPLTPQYDIQFGSGMTTLSDGTLAIASSHHLYCFDATGKISKPLALPPDPTPSLCPMPAGRGVVALCYGKRLSEDRLESTLWIKPEVLTGAWKKVASVDHHSIYWHHFRLAGVDPSGTQAYLVSGLLGATVDDPYTHYGYHGYGQRKYQVLSVNLETGKIETAFRSLEVDRIFFSQAPATPAPAGAGPVPPRTQEPQPDSGELRIGAAGD